jgi:hypothetical protein
MNYLNFVFVGVDPETGLRIGEIIVSEGGTKKKKLFLISDEVDENGMNKTIPIEGGESEDLEYDLLGDYMAQFCPFCGARLESDECPNDCHFKED